MIKYVFPINLPANYEQKESQYIYSKATLSKLRLRVTIALRVKDREIVTGNAKKSETINGFKADVKKWKPFECPWRLLRSPLCDFF